MAIFVVALVNVLDHQIFVTGITTVGMDLMKLTAVSIHMYVRIYGTAHLQGKECPRETRAQLLSNSRATRVHAKLLAVEYPAESSENHKLLGW